MNQIPNYYAIIPASVRYNEELSAQEKLLYGEITALTNYKGYCWATNNYFADLYKLSKETISRQISKLEKMGFIRTEIICFENSKQIKERRIFLASQTSKERINEVLTPIDENINTPIDENINTPIDENIKDNNININTTRMNKSMSCHVMSNKSSKKISKEKTDETNDNDNDFPTQPNMPTKKNRQQQTATDESNGLKSLSNPYTTKDEYTIYLKTIQENIEYSHFLHNRPTDIGLVDELVNCVLDVVLTKGETVKINGEEKNRQLVISQYLKINYTDIDHILDQFKKQRHKITHLHSYLKTILYTIKQEQVHYYANSVRVDGIIN